VVMDSDTEIFPDNHKLPAVKLVTIWEQQWVLQDAFLPLHLLDILRLVRVHRQSTRKLIVKT
jgi:hypothetical protein